ncbi:MAG: hypothetical protein Q8Q12_21245 [bacterium]|nr:hypothetical protein [bacterium]
MKRRVGSSEFDRALGKNHAKWSHLASSPARLITGVLEQGCLHDAEFLASCAMAVEESRASLEAALREGLAAKGATLPLGSRLWAESLLGHRVPAEIQGRNLEATSDVNLDRMATMLLAAWDAKDEGRKSQHVFQILSGICRTGFKLSLAGEPGETSPFNPATHQSIEPSIRSGVIVRIARPRVQWSDGLATRIIIRSLVAPLERADDSDPA